MPKTLEVPARQGRAIFVERGQALRVINTHGHQVVDFWAFHSTNCSNYLSMKHCRVASGHVNPRAGDTLVDNRRDPMLKFESDDSPGIHDTLLPACDRFRYIQLGVKGFHDSCADNLQRALASLNRAAPETPQPLNLWMNIPFVPAGEFQYKPPVSKPGAAVVLRALVDCIMVMSACPQDQGNVPVNAGKPVSVHYELVD
jgi:uncharacterized protein YcgI (DUF1989 family)